MRAQGLYKQLLRYGQALQYTDKKFYFRKVRAEFENNRNLTEQDQISFQLEKGAAFLRNRLMV